MLLYTKKIASIAQNKSIRSVSRAMYVKNVLRYQVSENRIGAVQKKMD